MRGLKFKTMPTLRQIIGILHIVPIKGTDTKGIEIRIMLKSSAHVLAKQSFRYYLLTKLSLFVFQTIPLFSAD